MATQTLGPRFGLPRIMILIKPITPIRIHAHPQIFNLVLLFKLIWRFFLEHNTTMRPITTLMSEIPKAHPKPIFLFLPRQPTPNANATAITKKRVFPYSYYFYCYFGCKNNKWCWMLQMFRLHKACGGNFFPSLYICLQKRTNFAIS